MQKNLLRENGICRGNRVHLGPGPQAPKAPWKPLSLSGPLQRKGSSRKSIPHCTPETPRNHIRLQPPPYQTCKGASEGAHLKRMPLLEATLRLPLSPVVLPLSSHQIVRGKGKHGGHLGTPYSHSKQHWSSISMRQGARMTFSSLGPGAKRSLGLAPHPGI